MANLASNPFLAFEDDSVEVIENDLPACKNTTFGCCPDSEVPAHGPNQEGCCIDSELGCCPDNIRLAHGTNGEGCDCESSVHACCPDGKVSHNSRRYAWYGVRSSDLRCLP